MDLTTYNRMSLSKLPRIKAIIKELEREICSCGQEYAYTECSLCKDDKLMIRELEQVINKHMKVY